MKCIIRLFLSFSIFFTLLSCEKKAEPEPVQEPCDFAVLVYMVASNSLGSDGYDKADSIEMVAAASEIPANTRWLVYHASTDATAPVTLRELKRDGTWVLHKEYTTHQSAKPERLAEVISDFREICEPKADGIVFWSHASGWLEDGNNAAAKSGLLKSYGVDFGNRMNITDMAPVLEAKPFRFIYFDACYMATVEVAYELRKSADYIVASPSEVPANGMPYHLNMPLLLGGTLDDLLAAAKNTFDLYNNQSDPVYRTCTMSVINTDALDRLAEATRPIYEVTPLKHPLTLVTNYRGTATNGYSLDFGEYVEALCDDSELDPALKAEFESALGAAVVYSAATPRLWASWPLVNPTGLATYVFNEPSKYYTKGYDALQWADKVVKPRLNNE